MQERHALYGEVANLILDADREPPEVLADRIVDEVNGSGLGGTS
jgi:hypothetical protein